MEIGGIGGWGEGEMGEKGEMGGQGDKERIKTPHSSLLTIPNSPCPMPNAQFPTPYSLLTVRWLSNHFLVSDRETALSQTVLKQVLWEILAVAVSLPTVQLLLRKC